MRLTTWRSRGDERTAAVAVATVALYDFGDGNDLVPARRHPYGGGWVANTAHADETVYVGPNALVYGYARVYGYAKVYDHARVYGNASVGGRTWVGGHSHVFGHADIHGNVRVFGNAWVYGNSRGYDTARIYGNSRVFGNAQIFGNARVYDNAWVLNSGWVFGDARVFGNAKVFRNAYVSHRAEVCGVARVIHTARGRVFGDAHVKNLRPYLCANARSFHAREAVSFKPAPLSLSEMESLVADGEAVEFEQSPYYAPHMPNRNFLSEIDGSWCWVRFAAHWRKIYEANHPDLGGRDVFFYYLKTVPEDMLEEDMTTMYGGYVRASDILVATGQSVAAGRDDPRSWERTARDAGTADLQRGVSDRLEVARRH